LVGDSDSGKTTLLEQLLPVLAARGLAVASVKHASHGFDVDRPGSDSHRHYTAGAQAVAVICDSAIVTFERRDAQHTATLEEALATLPDGLDLVLVEGFGWEPIPRLVLVPPDRMPRREHRESGPVLRVIRVPESAPEQKPAFSDDLVQKVASEIVVWLQRHPIPKRERHAHVAVSGFRGARSTPRSRPGRSGRSQ
jgi:molybdopterin-guanine dinucleotide biosynthesis protein B